MQKISPCIADGHYSAIKEADKKCLPNFPDWQLDSYATLASINSTHFGIHYRLVTV